MLRYPLYRYGDETGQVPAHMNFGKEVYDNMCKNRDMIALILSDTDEKLTYGEVAQQTANIALSLTRMGVEKGDVIAICSDKRFEFLPTVLGVMCAGATFTPTDPTYSSHPLLHRLKISKPKVMFTTATAYDTHKETFEAAGSIDHYILYGDEKREGTILLKDFITATSTLEEFQPVEVEGWKDLMFIIYSSGTTGLPKGVPTTHLNFGLNSRCMVPDSYKGIRVLNTREWYYTYGLMYTLACFRSGVTVVYTLGTQHSDMLEAVHKYKTEVIQAAPSTVTEMIKSTILDKYNMSSVRYIVSSSTYIRKDAIQAIKQRLPALDTVLQFYGMTEAGSICNELSATKGNRPGSSGTPSLGFILKVVELETRKPLGTNQLGEICVKGPSVIKQYLYNVAPDCKDEEGFLKTGDVGYYDNDGYFYIVNRIKELIKFNDISIPPAEFEDILQQHPSVREVGVVGTPHPIHGEVAVAFVALQPGCEAVEQELVEYVDSRVTYRMRLAGGVRFIDKLPRGAGEKLDRLALKNILSEETKKINRAVS